MKCRYRSSFILQFWFEELSDAVAEKTSLNLDFSSFRNPQSSQVLSGTSLVSFSDSQCLKQNQERTLPDISIQPRISSTELKLKAGNQYLGTTKADNTLKMTIENPEVNMAKGTSGKLEVIFPSWYKVGEVSAPSFVDMMC